MYTLTSISVGESGIIKKILPKCSLKQRLYDLGFVPGTKITCVLKSPLGDPKAYIVRGTVISVRHEDAENIIIQ